MQNQSFASTPSSKMRRHDGPVGGVAAGLARTFGIEAGFVRLVFVAAAILMGPIVVAAYIGLWYVMPVDESVPLEHRPDAPPIALVVILALIFGLGFAFDLAFGLASLVSSIPGWLIVGALVYFIVKRAKK